MGPSFLTGGILMPSDRVCPTFRKVFIASVFGVVVCLIPNGAQSATNNTATVQWDANQESDLAGYRVYQGTTSGSYGPAVDVGNITLYTAQNLQAGLTYYFAVRPPMIPVAMKASPPLK